MNKETPRSQALISRNRALTQEEFSDHWYSKHAAIVLPYFLSLGYQYYAQVLPHRLTTPISPPFSHIHAGPSLRVELSLMHEIDPRPVNLKVRRSPKDTWGVRWCC